ncbi:hypothetical protein F0562_026396 [Nyssa sinensis]|uniref:WRKY domain-containing protein n=1 Tax=Nyssa sinensis TaxID=561372 RepID=A0A5J5BAN0_9ASTE|nr:hypothetical protein F0562_026396 [Nyssa sinensis]
METPWPEKICTNREKVMEELAKGRDFTTQLQVLLDKPVGDHGSVLAEELLVKILRSFTDTLSVLSPCKSAEVCQIPVTARVGSHNSGDRKSENSGESSKTPALKEGRGCYKRRRTLDSWIIVSPTMEDEYAWRKYGQKGILNAKFPRCYFRCAHKKNQGCGAIKQVQRMKEDPNMYQTTYFGRHTCRETPAAPRMIISDSDPVESYLLSFESKKISTELVKEESKEETHSDPCNNLSSLDSIVWPDLMAMESFGAALMMGSNHDHDQDVISSVYSSASTSPAGLDVDCFIKHVDFDNDFHFDEIEFI